MPTLLFVSTRTDHPGREPGTVVTCCEDRPLGEEEARSFLVLRVDMPPDEARAIYCADGVPLEVRQAAADEWARFMAARKAFDKYDPVKDFLLARPEEPVLDRKIIDAAIPAIWPARMARIDLDALDKTAVGKARASWAAIDGAKVAIETATVDAKTAAQLRATADVAMRGGDVAAAALADAAIDAICTAETDARKLALRAAWADVPMPDVIDLDAKQLSAVTVPGRAA